MFVVVDFGVDSIEVVIVFWNDKLRKEFYFWENSENIILYIHNYFLNVICSEILYNMNNYQKFIIRIS